MKIFIVDSNTAINCRKKLKEHLALNRKVNVWHRENVEFSCVPIDQQISNKFREADVILYLVTSTIIQSQEYFFNPAPNQKCFNIIVGACIVKDLEEIADNLCLHNPKTNFNKATDKDEFIVECITTLMDNYATQ